MARLKRNLIAATIVLLAGTIAYLVMGVVLLGHDSPTAKPDVRAAVAITDPNWTPSPLGLNEKQAGNCVVPKEAVEVLSVAASPGGRVLDTEDSRYYSLPDGRCVKLVAAEPFPDWVPPELETGDALPVGPSEGGAE